MLDRECGSQIYELIARDHPDAAPGVSTNAYPDTLAARSEGLPLYLRQLERLHVSDVWAVLTPVFGVLAVARGPLT